jgi:LuxR family maltose regulon positive regulatory protein
MLAQAASTGDADYLEAVEHWVEARGLRADGEIKSLNDEFEYLVWVRLLIIQNEPGQALKLLARLLQAAEDGGRTGRVIEMLTLQALAQGALGDTQQALIPLERALSLAEPEGYVRLFVDEGEPMAMLLYEAAARGISPNYANKLLAAFGAEAQRRRGAGEQKLAPSRPSPSAPSPLPLEPLSDRELEVLRLLLNTDLSAPEIAVELVVSVNTVRTHIKRIYSKLDAHSRYEAVQRAKEIDLL